MSKRDENFAGKHGYTMAQVEQAVLSFLLEKECPVWSPCDITRRLYNKSTRSPQYRHVISACKKMRRRGDVGMTNMVRANNTTVVWAASRMNPPVVPELPF